MDFLLNSLSQQSQFAALSLTDQPLQDLRAIITQIISFSITGVVQGFEQEHTEKLITLIKSKISNRILESTGHTISDEIDTHIMEVLNINFI